jgi:hypothetical protein
MEQAGQIPDLPSPAKQRADRVLSEAGFSRLGEQIFLYTPSTTTSIDANSQSDTDASAASTPPPDLVIICSWMYAQSKHVLKNTVPYQQLFPSSPILLLKQDGKDIFFRTISQQITNLKPAIEFVDLIAARGARQNRAPRVHMHAFSNGGAHTALTLADAFALSHSSSSVSPGGAFPSKSSILPLSSLILDSTPSSSDPFAAHIAISEVLPKSPLPLKLACDVVVWSYLIITRLLSSLPYGPEDIIIALRRRLNDPDAAFTQPGSRRCYIYSKGDKLVGWKDVESHAWEARKVLGNERVGMEDFGATMHVGHVRGDAERYWRVVKELWAESVGSTTSK